MVKYSKALPLPSLRTAIVLTWTFFIIICLGILTPLPQAVDVPRTDKWHHFVAFAALTSPLTVASRSHWVLIITIGFSFGGLIEITQPYVNGFGDISDFITDSFGVLIEFLLGVVGHYLKLKSAA